MKFKQLTHKIAASAILTAFFVTNHFNLPLYAAESVSPQISITQKFPADLKSVELPQELGKIDDVFQGSSEKTVIVVQDAHAIPEAQRNIEKIIEHFQKMYGINFIGLEGANSQLDPQIFKSFPNKELLRNVFNDYFERGELTGGTAAAIFSGTPSVFHGIENWELYEQGVGLYLAAMTEEPQLTEKLQAWKRDLEKRKQTTYPDQLLEIDQKLKEFKTSNSDLLAVLKFLASIKQPEQGTQLAVILEESEKEGKTDGELAIEVERIAKQVAASLRGRNPHVIPARFKRESSSADPRLKHSGMTENLSRNDIELFNQKYQQFHLSRISPSAFALFLKELTEKDSLPIQVSPELLSGINNQKMIREIEGTKFFFEFEAYAQRVKDSLIQTEAQKKLEQESRYLDLADRLIRLELSREDWQELTRSVIPERFNSAGMTENDLKLHFAFYENAEQRDQALLEHLFSEMKKHVIPERLNRGSTNLDSRLKHAGMTENSTALLVAGGFHAHGIIQRLKEENISYLIVMPAISKLPAEIHYRDQMQGDLSWKNYFKVENGKINMYKAFVRAARDKLLQLSKDAQNLGKAWRDQIIRDLADKREIAKAGKYTQFIDERYQTESDPKITAALEKISQFIEKLRGLQIENRLTEENVLKLLTPSPSTISVPGVSIALDSEGQLSEPNRLAERAASQVASETFRQESRAKQPVVPDGMTYLIHETNLANPEWDGKERVLFDDNNFLVERAGLSVDTAEKFQEERSSGQKIVGYSVTSARDDLTEQAFTERNRPVQVRVIFFSNYSNNPELAQRFLSQISDQSRLKSISELIDVYYFKHPKGRRHPVVPRKTNLIKLAHTKEDNVDVFWYIPADIKDIYDEWVMRGESREKPAAAADRPESRASLELLKERAIRATLQIDQQAYIQNGARKQTRSSDGESILSITYEQYRALPIDTVLAKIRGGYHIVGKSKISELDPIFPDSPLLVGFLLTDPSVLHSISAVNSRRMSRRVSIKNLAEIFGVLATGLVFGIFALFSFSHSFESITFRQWARKEIRESKIKGDPFIVDVPSTIGYRIPEKGYEALPEAIEKQIAGTLKPDFINFLGSSHLITLPPEDSFEKPDAQFYDDLLKKSLIRPIDSVKDAALINQYSEKMQEFIQSEDPNLVGVLDQRNTEELIRISDLVDPDDSEDQRWLEFAGSTSFIAADSERIIEADINGNPKGYVSQRAETRIGTRTNDVQLAELFELYKNSFPMSLSYQENGQTKNVHRAQIIRTEKGVDEKWTLYFKDVNAQTSEPLAVSFDSIQRVGDDLGGNLLLFNYHHSRLKSKAAEEDGKMVIVVRPHILRTQNRHWNQLVADLDELTKMVSTDSPLSGEMARRLGRVTKQPEDGPLEDELKGPDVRVAIVKWFSEFLVDLSAFSLKSKSNPRERYGLLVDAQTYDSFQHRIDELEKWHNQEMSGYVNNVLSVSSDLDFENAAAVFAKMREALEAVRNQMEQEMVQDFVQEALSLLDRGIKNDNFNHESRLETDLMKIREISKIASAFNSFRQKFEETITPWPAERRTRVINQLAVVVEFMTVAYAFEINDVPITGLELSREERSAQAREILSRLLADGKDALPAPSTPTSVSLAQLVQPMQTIIEILDQNIAQAIEDEQQQQQQARSAQIPMDDSVINAYLTLWGEEAKADPAAFTHDKVRVILSTLTKDEVGKKYKPFARMVHPDSHFMKELSESEQKAYITQFIEHGEARKTLRNFISSRAETRERKPSRKDVTEVTAYFRTIYPGQPQILQNLRALFSRFSARERQIFLIFLQYHRQWNVWPGHVQVANLIQELGFSTERISEITVASYINSRMRLKMKDSGFPGEYFPWQREGLFLSRIVREINSQGLKQIERVLTPLSSRSEVRTPEEDLSEVLVESISMLNNMSGVTSPQISQIRGKINDAENRLGRTSARASLGKALLDFIEAILANNSPAARQAIENFRVDANRIGETGERAIAVMEKILSESGAQKQPEEVLSDKLKESILMLQDIVQADSASIDQIRKQIVQTESQLGRNTARGFLAKAVLDFVVAMKNKNKLAAQQAISEFKKYSDRIQDLGAQAVQIMEQILEQNQQMSGLTDANLLNADEQKLIIVMTEAAKDLENALWSAVRLWGRNESIPPNAVTSERVQAYLALRQNNIERFRIARALVFAILRKLDVIDQTKLEEIAVAAGALQAEDGLRRLAQIVDAPSSAQEDVKEIPRTSVTTIQSERQKLIDITAEKIAKDESVTIAFICTANMNRSTIAHVLFEDQAKKQKKTKVNVRSGGLMVNQVGNQGSGIKPAFKQILDSQRIDRQVVDSFRSRQIAREDIVVSDLIVVASKAHEEALIQAIPEAAGKVVLFTETHPNLSKFNGEMPDPMAGQISDADLITLIGDTVIPRLFRPETRTNNLKDLHKQLEQTRRLYDERSDRTAELAIRYEENLSDYLDTQSLSALNETDFQEIQSRIRQGNNPEEQLRLVNNWLMEKDKNTLAGSQLEKISAFIFNIQSHDAEMDLFSDLSSWFHKLANKVKELSELAGAADQSQTIIDPIESLQRQIDMATADLRNASAITALRARLKSVIAGDENPVPADSRALLPSLDRMIENFRKSASATQSTRPLADWATQPIGVPTSLPTPKIRQSITVAEWKTIVWDNGKEFNFENFVVRPGHLPDGSVLTQFEYKGQFVAILNGEILIKSASINPGFNTRTGQDFQTASFRTTQGILSVTLEDPKTTNFKIDTSSNGLIQIRAEMRDQDEDQVGKSPVKRDGFRVLVVDDSQFEVQLIWGLVNNNFKKRGLKESQVHVAKSRVNALQRFRNSFALYDDRARQQNRPYDLVITDMTMEETETGLDLTLELLNVIKSNNLNTQIIIRSSYQPGSDVVKEWQQKIRAKIDELYLQGIKVIFLYKGDKEGLPEQLAELLSLRSETRAESRENIISQEGYELLEGRLNAIIVRDPEAVLMVETMEDGLYRAMRHVYLIGVEQVGEGAEPQLEIRNSFGVTREIPLSTLEGIYENNGQGQNLILDWVSEFKNIPPISLRSKQRVQVPSSLRPETREFLGRLSVIQQGLGKIVLKPQTQSDQAHLTKMLTFLGSISESVATLREDMARSTLPASEFVGIEDSLRKIEIQRKSFLERVELYLSLLGQPSPSINRPTDAGIELPSDAGIEEPAWESDIDLKELADNMIQILNGIIENFVTDDEKIQLLNELIFNEEFWAREFMGVGNKGYDAVQLMRSAEQWADSTYGRTNEPNERLEDLKQALEEMDRSEARQKSINQLEDYLSELKLLENRFNLLKGIPSLIYSMPYVVEDFRKLDDLLLIAAANLKLADHKVFLSEFNEVAKRVNALKVNLIAKSVSDNFWNIVPTAGMLLLLIFLIEIIFVSSFTGLKDLILVTPLLVGTGVMASLVVFFLSKSPLSQLPNLPVEQDEKARVESRSSNKMLEMFLNDQTPISFFTRLTPEILERRPESRIEISSEQLENILDQFGLERKRNVIQMYDEQSSYANSVLVPTVRGNYIIGRTGWRQRSGALVWEMEVRNGFKASGLSWIPKMMTTQDGHPFAQVDNKYFIVSEFLPGERVKWGEIQGKKLINVAQVQAVIHDAGSKLILRGQNLTAQEQVYPLGDLLHPENMIAFYERVAEKMKRGPPQKEFKKAIQFYFDHKAEFDAQLSHLQSLVQSDAYKGLFQTVIHGDFNSRNILFEGDNVSGVIDFDYARKSLRIQDIANGSITMEWWGEAVDFSPLIQYLKAYQAKTQNKITDQEIHMLPEAYRAWFFEGLGLTLMKIINNQKSSTDLFERIKGNLKMFQALDRSLAAGEWEPVFAAIRPESRSHPDLEPTKRSYRVEPGEEFTFSTSKPFVLNQSFPEEEPLPPGEYVGKSSNVYGFQYDNGKLYGRFLFGGIGPSQHPKVEANMSILAKPDELSEFVKQNEWVGMPEEDLFEVRVQSGVIYVKNNGRYAIDLNYFRPEMRSNQLRLPVPPKTTKLEPIESKRVTSTLPIPSRTELLNILKQLKIAVFFAKVGDAAYSILRYDEEGQVLDEASDFLASPFQEKARAAVYWPYADSVKAEVESHFSAKLAEAGKGLEDLWTEAFPEGYQGKDASALVLINTERAGTALMQMHDPQRLDQAIDRALFEETIHALEGIVNEVDSAEVHLAREIINDVLQILFIQPEGFQLFDSNYTDWHTNYMTALHDRYIGDLNPNVNMHAILERLHDDVKQNTLITAPRGVLQEQKISIIEVLFYKHLTSTGDPSRSQKINEYQNYALQYLDILLRTNRFAEVSPLFVRPESREAVANVEFPNLLPVILKETTVLTDEIRAEIRQAIVLVDNEGIEKLQEALRQTYLSEGERESSQYYEAVDYVAGTLDRYRVADAKDKQFAFGLVLPRSENSALTRNILSVLGQVPQLSRVLVSGKVSQALQTGFNRRIKLVQNFKNSVILPEDQQSVVVAVMDEQNVSAIDPMFIPIEMTSSTVALNAAQLDTLQRIMIVLGIHMQAAVIENPALLKDRAALRLDVIRRLNFSDVEGFLAITGNGFALDPAQTIQLAIKARELSAQAA